MHHPLFEYGDADSLSPQDTTSISAQSTAICSARGDLKTNKGIYYNHSKLGSSYRIFVFRARIVTLFTRAATLLALLKLCSHLNEI